MSARFFFHDTVTGLWDFGQSGGFSIRNFYASGSINGASLTTTGNATIGGTLGVTGPVTLTDLLSASGNIKFLATQAASANANTLDDYEEGTFTPSLFGSTTPGTPIYSTQLGRYTKVGNRVYGTIFIAITSRGGMVGGLRIDGLPFTLINNTSARAALSIAYALDMNLPANVPVLGMAFNNTDEFFLYTQNATGAPNVLNAATGITDTFNLYASFHYETN